LQNCRQGFWLRHVDAVFERDLETTGQVGWTIGLSVGASGFGLGLARALVARAVKATHQPRFRFPSEPAACLAGSCSQATLQQIAKAEAVMPVLHLDPMQLSPARTKPSRAGLGQRKG